MAPFIKDGDLVEIAPLEKGRVSVGSVIAFRDSISGGLIVHRVVKARGGNIWTRGDAVVPHLLDSPIGQGDILGQVTRVERNGAGLRLGLGPEGAAIAWLSRSGYLPLLVRIAARIRRMIGR
jgi:hypothetical protein